MEFCTLCFCKRSYHKHLLEFLPPNTWTLTAIQILIKMSPKYKLQPHSPSEKVSYHYNICRALLIQGKKFDSPFQWDIQRYGKSCTCPSLVNWKPFNHSKNLDSTTIGQAVLWVLGIKWETGRVAYILKGKTDNTYIVSGAKSDGWINLHPITEEAGEAYSVVSSKIADGMSRMTEG